MSNTRIFIVDDDAWVLEFLRTVVTHAFTDSAVETCASPRDALARLDDGEPHILLSDIEMPGMSGIELTRHVLTHPHTPTVILMTDNHTLLPLAMEAGAYSCLPKPVRLDLLTNVLQRALDYNSLQRRIEKLQQILVNHATDDYSEQVRVRSHGVERRMEEMRREELTEIMSVWQRYAPTRMASQT